MTRWDLALGPEWKYLYTVTSTAWYTESQPSPKDENHKDAWYAEIHRHCWRTTLCWGRSGGSWCPLLLGRAPCSFLSQTVKQQDCFRLLEIKVVTGRQTLPLNTSRDARQRKQTWFQDIRSLPRQSEIEARRRRMNGFVRGLKPRSLEVTQLLLRKLSGALSCLTWVER